MRTTRAGFAFLMIALLAVPALADSGAAHQAKQTVPVKMGTSGGSLNDRSSAFCCGGTLGALVTRNGVLSILSNNHVLARSGSAAVGEDTIQPGLIDVGCNGANSNVVGDFFQNVVPLGTANVDAAVSTARSGQVDTTGAILNIGVPCGTPEPPAIGKAVRKSGRTTGLTTGTIQSISTSVSIQYQKGCNSGKKFTVGYTNQVVITAGSGSFSAGGDSGSLILSNDDGSPNPVALLFAGNSTQTIGNPIGDVISAFGAKGHTIAFVGNNCTASTSSAPDASGSFGKGSAITPLDSEIEFVRSVKERNEQSLFSRLGVIGVGVGIDESDPSRGAIVVYTSNGSGARLRPGLFPAEIEGVKVRVIPTEPFVAQ